MQTLPKHIAIVMDGNGRWAAARNLPRLEGHLAGVAAVRKIVQACCEQGIGALSLFAFSSENWRRPEAEVAHIFELFFSALGEEIEQLHNNGVQFRVIGDRSQFSPELQTRIAASETLTATNQGLKLIIAANYGGRWDITQACQKISIAVQAQELDPRTITENLVQNYLALSDIPEPDLFIRTSGEQRISNFFIWQLSYTELYFPSCHWPDFDEAAFAQALEVYKNRQRRFGSTGEQLEAMDLA